MMTRQEFHDACEHFDWFYQMSDDGRVWRRGEAAEKALLAHAPAGSDNRKIWEAWTAHYYSGTPWNTPKAPRPERPVG